MWSNDTYTQAINCRTFANREDVQYILSSQPVPIKALSSEIIGVMQACVQLPIIRTRLPPNFASTPLIDQRRVLSIAGGKYTTYRIMAKDVIDLTVNELRKLS